jgi:hypothetical protein
VLSIKKKKHRTRDGKIEGICKLRDFAIMRVYANH